jgi:hypothetical protein
VEVFLLLLPTLLIAVLIQSYVAKVSELGVDGGSISNIGFVSAPVIVKEEFWFN